MIVRLASAVLLAVPAVAQDTVLVGPPGIGVTEDLQAAVELAPEGGTVLVVPGSYAAVSIDGRSVRLVAAPGGPVDVAKLTVRNLAAGQEVVLAGLTIGSTGGPALTVSQCAGALRVEACSATGWSAPLTAEGDGDPAALVVDADDVVFHRCTLLGGSAAHSTIWFARGGAGLAVSDSTVALEDCVVTGGEGIEDGVGVDGPDGGHGAVVFGGLLVLSDSRVRGGDGTRDFDSCDFSGDGGDALVLDGAAEVWRIDSNLIAGNGPPGPGCGICTDCGGGADGSNIRNLDGASSATLLPGTARPFETPSVAFEGTSPLLSVEGVPGELVYLLRGDAYAFRFVPARRGVLSLMSPPVAQLAPLGVIPASGVLELDWPVPALAAGVDAGLLRQQVLLRGPNGRLRLGHAASLPVVSCDVGPDCDGNGSSDICDLAVGLVPDCNGNGLSDACDVLLGNAQDTDGNGVLDECENYVRFHLDASAGPGGNGLTWAGAFRELDVALLAAAQAQSWFEVDVWVAAGTYVVAPGQFDAVVDGVHVYGGFVGGETSLDQRDPLLNVTRISGDVNGDDGPGFSNRSDNDGELLELYGESSVDGLVFSGANPGGFTAAVTSDISPEIVVRDCVFTDNGGNGAALWVRLVGSQSALIDGCTFEGNQSLGGGVAGLLIRGGPAAIAVVGHSIFRRNVGGTGAALFTQSEVSIMGCLLHDNVSTSGAGVVRTWGSSGSVVDDVSIVNTTIANNVGGGLVAQGGQLTTLRNSLLWGNELGGVVDEGAQVSTISGGAVGLEYTTVEGLSTLTGPGVSGLDPLFLDPDGADDVAGNADDNYRLGAGSPAVDSGDNAALPPDVLNVDDDGNTNEPWPRDLNGVPRRLDDPNVPDTGAGSAPIVDRGPFERT